MESAHKIIADHADAGIAARKDFFDNNTDIVVKAAQLLSICFAKGGKVLLCGNGGSAADAQHLAGEFMNRMLLERPPLAAIALSCDTSVLTAIGNDYSYDHIFSKQVEGLGKEGDVLLAISTSGNSENIVLAIDSARKKNMSVIGLTGHDAGKMKDMCDILLNVNYPSTPIVQEVHSAIEHLLCILCDYYLFQNGAKLVALMAQAGK